MANTTIPDRKVDTTEKTPARQQDGEGRLPHERDQSPDHGGKPRDVMKQAASDLEQGLVDTDLHGERGVEKVKPAKPQEATPVADGHVKPRQ